LTDPITCHTGTKGEAEVWLYPFLTLALDGGGWSTPGPDHFTHRKRPNTHCTGGWVSLRASLDQCKKSHPPQDSNTEPSN